MNNNNSQNIRYMVLSGIFIAIGVVLPITFHAIPDAGRIFLPMHLPILLLAFFVPWQYALAVGVITPLLSSFITGMPILTSIQPIALMMAFELGTYGVCISLLNKKFKNIKKWYAPLLSLIPALIAGRIVNAIVQIIAISFFGIKGTIAWTLLIGSTLKGLPGIAFQIVLIPILYAVIIKGVPSIYNEKKTIE